MARSKKTDEKPREGATLSIDVDSFVRTRDSVVTGLATLQDAIRQLSSAYIKHTNAVLGEHGAGMDVEAALLSLGDNPLLGGLGGLRAATPAKSPMGEVKAAKKKRAHDPNAPKRPLTPYFLYMQTARPIIAEDLGPDVAKGAVSTEGVKRWNAMAAADKQLWTNAYNDNLRLYNARVHSYKAGNLAAKDMSDEEAATYAEEHNIVLGPNDVTADGQLTSEALLDLPSATAAADAVDADEPEAPKATPKSKSRGKSSKASKPAGAGTTPAGAASTIVPTGAIIPPKPTAAAATAPPEAPEKEKSPDKKRKRTSKAAAAAAPEPVEEPVETPKTADKDKKPRKKKSKSDA